MTATAGLRRSWVLWFDEPLWAWRLGGFLPDGRILAAHCERCDEYFYKSAYGDLSAAPTTSIEILDASGEVEVDDYTYSVHLEPTGEPLASLPGEFIPVTISNDGAWAILLSVEGTEGAARLHTPGTLWRMALADGGLEELPATH